MIRTLLATTAVAAILALPVIAQDASSSMDSSMSSMDSSMSSMESSAMDSSAMTTDSSAMSTDSSAMSTDSSMMSTDSSMMSTDSSAMTTDSSMMSSEVTTDSSMMSTEVTGPFDIVTGYTQIDSDAFATRIIGQPVYDGTTADANKLGDITDIVLNESGTAQAVIIGVGGFLGIGEKQVAVAYSALTRQLADDGTERFVVETTVEDLTAAPDFVVVENEPDGTVSEPVSGDATGTSSAVDDAMATSSSSAM